ncbi:hypothetical protein [Lacticaseibacillus absianus]|uniref:hypothetical protein n=1 Tax=Lacticaseibacillus absianus TaxID=2729623 RepID=UPI0015CB258B|nr:hypothetical protein [Lacticaseibacillus absianus]
MHYNNLITDEKEQTVRRILSLFEGLPDWLKAERVQAETVLMPEEAEHLEEINAKIARVDQLVSQGQKLTVDEKKTLARMRAIYAANLEQLKIHYTIVNGGNFLMA